MAAGKDGAITPEARSWLAARRRHVDDHRRAADAASQSGLPVAGTADSVAQQAAEGMILSAHLVTWLENELASLLAERQPDADVAIVLTTSPVGLRVANDVLQRGEPLMQSLRNRLVAVTESEYRFWTKAHPDPDHRLHVNHWSWIKTRVPEARRQEFNTFPLGPHEQFWLHRTGTTGCGRERRYCHLWKWNGQTASLLKPFVDERVRRL